MRKVSEIASLINNYLVFGYSGWFLNLNMNVQFSNTCMNAFDGIGIKRRRPKTLEIIVQMDRTENAQIVATE